MSVFPQTHSERIAPGSFQQPVNLPAGLPGDPPFVSVCFNQNWLPYILGCLFQLTLSTTWNVSTDEDLSRALAIANNLILIFQRAKPGCNDKNPGYAGSGDDFMLRQNPDNPCLLETSVNGTDWCVWADLSKCTGQPTQPGKGSPNPPSGGCANSFGTVEFGSRWMLPQNVSSGDVITVTNVVGSWASALDLFIPRCPDGNIFFEVGCVSGTGHTEPGDPAPSINHDSLIAYDGTNYYDCGPASDGTPVVITIPPGISSANLFFFANTPDTSGYGAINFDVSYCNNAVPSWTHTFNFAASTQGWTVIPDASNPGGMWSAGVGFVSTDGAVSVSNHTREVGITKSFASTHITRIQALVNWTPGVSFPSVDIAFEFAGSGIATITKTSAAMPGTGTGVLLDTGIVSETATSIIVGLTCDYEPLATPLDGVAQIVQVVVSGDGPNPF